MYKVSAATMDHDDGNDISPIINAEDYGEIEAVHSDHEGISSGDETDDENENNYDLNDSFINNKTPSPLKTQQLLGYRKAMKTPKGWKNKLFGKDRMKWLDPVQSAEKRACEESYIDPNASYEDMEDYEDPDDPILPPYDPEKEGIHYEHDETSSDDDVCFSFHK